MGFSTDYLYYFHYSDSFGYLIFCCQNVAMKTAFFTDTPQWAEQQEQGL